MSRPAAGRHVPYERMSCAHGLSGLAGGHGLDAALLRLPWTTANHASRFMDMVRLPPAFGPRSFESTPMPPSAGDQGRRLHAAMPRPPPPARSLFALLATGGRLP